MRENQSNQDRRIFVGNLPIAATEGYLRELFEESGHAVEELCIMTNRETGRPRGYAFVTLAEGVDAKKVIQATNGQSFMGRHLTVKAATLKRSKKPLSR